MNGGDIYNQYTTKHDKDTLRIGHDIFLSWSQLKLAASNRGLRGPHDFIPFAASGACSRSNSRKFRTCRFSLPCDLLTKKTASGW
jgi:hypothetical protein